MDLLRQNSLLRQILLSLYFLMVTTRLRPWLKSRPTSTKPKRLCGNTLVGSLLHRPATVLRTVLMAAAAAAS